MKLIIFAAIIILTLPETALAEIERISISGQVSTIIEQKLKEGKLLEGVSIQIIEIDNEPAEAAVMTNIFRTDSEGIFSVLLDETIIEDIREVTSVKLKFTSKGYRDAYITVGPITESHARREESAEIKKNTYIEQLKIVLLPKSFDPSELVLESFKIDQDLSIFEKGNLVQSSSPFKYRPDLMYFHIQKDFGILKRLAGERHTSGSNPIFERVFLEVKPLVLAISDMASHREDVAENSVLKKIFSDTTGIELFKVLIPAGKSFMTNLEGLSDDDIRLRMRTFKLIAEMLKSLEQEEAPDPTLKRALAKYATVFRGLFEPLFIITIRNKGKHDYIMKQIAAEVREVQIYMGPEEKGKVPITAIYDIPIEPKVGITEIPMDPELRIFPKGSTIGPDIISFKIRLIPQTPYLHSYLMRLKILTDRDLAISTPLFVIDM